MVAIPESVRLRFGHDLRTFREKAGLSQQQLARAVPMSQSMLSAVERGAKTTRRDQIARLDDVLNTGGALVRRWEDYAHSTGYADWFRGVVSMEREASEIREYHPLLIPGLLQTEAYARTIIRLGKPADTDNEVEEQVAARLERQQLFLSERPPLLMVVLDETVLRRPVGGRDIMRKQLDRLLEIGSWSRATVQIIPWMTEQHPGLDGAFRLISASNRGIVAFVETRVSGTPIDDSTTIESFLSLYGDLRGVALPPTASRDLIEKARREIDA